jgi:peptidoglycan/LPS O-acetylase OafA/YrhL
MIFRSDINGLRALAVIPVLFFHAHLQGFEGGFLGVDVFFVISGFLITSIILKDMETKQFSLLSFWNKRIRRIFPALIFISIIVTIISIFTMLPYDLKNYGQSLFATIFSANNILLYLTSGYWSLAAEFKPLYHTWSLGVEDQYYFLIPLLIILFFNKFSRLVLFFSFLFVVSFILSFTETNKEMNFLIISHRLWELMAGSLVALYISKYKVNSNNIMASFGLLLIIYSYALPYSFTNNQALYTLLPVLGTVLIILYSSNKSTVGKLLSIKPLLFIGTISYSIYLFHMPLLAFLRLSMENQASVYLEVFFVLVSIPIAYLSWKYIENFFRDKKNISNKKFYILLVMITTVLLLIGLSLHYTYGFQKYSKYSYGSNPQRYNDEPKIYNKDSYTTNKPKLLVIGDSFARDFINMIRENYNINRFELIYIHSNEYSNSPKNLFKDADTIIAVSSFGKTNNFNKNEVTNFSEKLFQFLSHNSNKKFYYVGTKNFGFNNNFVLNKTFNQSPKYSVKVNQSNILANELEKSIWKDHYIDILDVLLDKENKVSIFTSNGEFISFDTEHLTKEGAKYIGNKIFKKTRLKNIMSEIYDEARNEQ